MAKTKSFQKTWSDLLQGNVNPKSVAFGVALGTFVSLLPTFGFSILLAIGLIVLLPKVNKPAVFIALAIWNPLVQIPIYALSFEIGSMLYENAPVINYHFELLNQAFNFTRRFLVAHIIITLVCTLIAFIAAYLLALAYQKQLRKITLNTDVI